MNPSADEPEEHENLLNFRLILFTYNTTQRKNKKKESFEKHNDSCLIFVR
jgi:hypothetical protein